MTALRSELTEARRIARHLGIPEMLKNICTGLATAAFLALFASGALVIADRQVVDVKIAQVQP